MKRSEIWLINLDPTIGAEIKKVRPAVILSHDDLGVLPLKVIVPLTEWKNQYKVAEWMVRINPDRINNLDKTSSADALQIRCVSSKDLLIKLDILICKLFHKLKKQ